MNLYETVKSAIDNLQLSKEEIIECEENEAISIQNKIKEAFIKGEPRAWWLSLKQPYEKIEFSNGEGYKNLAKFVPKNELKCWFIPETGDINLPVFYAKVDVITLVLAECHFFEYYLVGKQFDWMIIENDHNELIISKV